MEGRCMKCRTQKKMKDIVMTKTKRGTYMARGRCESCGTTVCKVCSISEGDRAIATGEARRRF